MEPMLRILSGDILFVKEVSLASLLDSLQKPGHTVQVLPGNRPSAILALGFELSKRNINPLKVMFIDGVQS